MSRLYDRCAAGFARPWHRPLREGWRC